MLWVFNKSRNLTELAWSNMIIECFLRSSILFLGMWSTEISTFSLHSLHWSIDGHIHSSMNLLIKFAENCSIGDYRRCRSFIEFRYFYACLASNWRLLKMCRSKWYSISSILYAIYNLVIILGPLLSTVLFNLMVLSSIRQVHHRCIPYMSVVGTNTSTVRVALFHRKGIYLIKLSLIQSNVNRDTQVEGHFC